MAANPSTVSEYLEALPKEVRPIIERVREAIRAALPGAVERVPYELIERVAAELGRARRDSD